MLNTGKTFYNVYTPLCPLPLQACRDFNDDGTCVNACPPMTLYIKHTQEVMNNPNAKYSYGATCVKACPGKNDHIFVLNMSVFMS